MELYISDHPLDCLTCAANGDCELQDMAGAVGLREVRYGYEGANHLDAEKDESNPYFTFDPAKCIVCSRCVRACEEVQGTFALTIIGARLRERRVARRHGLPGLRMRVLRRLRAGLPDGDADREERDRGGPARACVVTTCAYCGVGCSFKAEMQGDEGRAHGALQGRQGEPRAILREGPLRLGLRHPQGPHHQADDPREDHRPLAGGDLGRGDQPRRQRVQAHPGEVRPRLDRRHHLLALHQRGDLPRAEAGPRRVRQQQRRHLRARLPFADRLRPEDDVRHLRRHAGFRLGRQGRRHPGHRRQPDRRASGVRLAHEAAAARGRAADRRRPAPHRPREDAACRGRLPPAAAARHQRRADQRDGACRRHRGAGRRGLRRASAATRRISSSGRASSPRSAIRPRRAEGADRRAGRRRARRRAALRHRRQRRDLLRPRRHRAQPGLDHGHGHGEPRHGDRQHRPATASA